ncbi:MAG: hypothetical protein HQK88_14695 [Nitrospirae bacterium]|nr:hypothetical protein [Nitrospirota bacterium]MBF0521360.1 hypothetical protein [Nitrospirota bacterium]MBF0535976.1 hypothetical protein [Nitrospirota bacterium]MBF0618047.1 hypothetical protein [Nitrospirota bacterium]
MEVAIVKKNQLDDLYYSERQRVLKTEVCTLTLKGKDGHAALLPSFEVSSEMQEIARRYAGIPLPTEIFKMRTNELYVDPCFWIEPKMAEKSRLFNYTEKVIVEVAPKLLNQFIRMGLDFKVNRNGEIGHVYFQPFLDNKRILEGFFGEGIKPKVNKDDTISEHFKKIFENHGNFYQEMYNVSIDESKGLDWHPECDSFRTSSYSYAGVTAGCSGWSKMNRDRQKNQYAKEIALIHDALTAKECAASDIRLN